MIFITLGSQKFQFDRLLKKIDILIKNKIIKGDVFAQIGYSEYKPELYDYKVFLNREEFDEMIEKSEIIITHGGTGTIINAVKKGKKVIGIPRLVEYGEHVDNHQQQIIKQFEECNLIKAVYDLNDLEKVIKNIYDVKFQKYVSNTQNLILDIEKYIEEN